MALKLHACALLLTLLSAPLCAQPWTALGPHGGDARTITRDPHSDHRLVLTTSNGAVFESLDDGNSWLRLAQLGDGGYVLDQVVFHPQRRGIIYVAAWSLEKHSGEIFRTQDSGRTWIALRQMHGKSVRALAMAPSDPKILIAGALDGVYRSRDGGDRWELISPPEHADLRNIESVAIDPTHADIIYAGTWHLPWKTEDGGLTWKNIKKGIIDDSDVFSILIDPTAPNVVYASACSGIYKSENAGEQFRKIQGIPYSARRTRVLRQDPAEPAIVYAGTTEGLWKTSDAGRTWARMTPANVIVNDVAVDPAKPHHLLLASDRGGVLSSRDGGHTFAQSNLGFVHRNVATLLVDRDDPSIIYAGVLNDKEHGGVFVSRDAGMTWQQMNAGLSGADFFVLHQNLKGELFAGTNRGVYVYRAAAGEYRWKPLGATPKQAASPRIVYDLEWLGSTLLAASNRGLFLWSATGWRRAAIESEGNFVAVTAREQTIAAVSRRAIVISRDKGETWHAAAVPEGVTIITDAALDDIGALYLATREGAFRMEDGEEWKRLNTLPANNVSSIQFDDASGRLIATSTSTTQLFESLDRGRKWKAIDAGWALRTVRPVAGGYVAATISDGIVAHVAERQSASTETSVGGSQ